MTHDKDKSTKPQSLQVWDVALDIQRQFRAYAKLHGLSQAETFTKAFKLLLASDASTTAE